MSVMIIQTDKERGVVTAGTFSGRGGRLVEHAALTREEALRTATGMLHAALDLPREASASGSRDGER